MNVYSVDCKHMITVNVYSSKCLNTNPFLWDYYRGYKNKNPLQKHEANPLWRQKDSMQHSGREDKV